LRRIFVFFIVVLLIAAGLYYYTMPSEKLNLAYSELSTVQKVKEMMASRHFELRLSEEDVNNILKKELSLNPQLKNQWTVQGARFTLADNQLNAHLNVSYKYLFTTEIFSTYQLKWESPNLVLTPIKYQLKDIPVPVNWVGENPIRINIGSELPPFLEIRSMSFQGQSILVQFRIKGW
jgi:hypothetical protein